MNNWHSIRDPPTEVAQCSVLISFGRKENMVKTKSTIIFCMLAEVQASQTTLHRCFVIHLCIHVNPSGFTPLGILPKLSLYYMQINAYAGGLSIT